MTIQQENSILLQRLHELQEELEAWRLDRSALKNTSEEPLHRATAIRLRKDFEKEKEKLQSTIIKLEEQMLEVDTLRSQSSETLFRLHETQEKLEQALWEKKYALPGNGVVGTTASGARAMLGEVQRNGTHRHLHFKVERMDLSDGGAWDAEIRLAHHEGRAGLVIFKGGNGGDLPFANWPDTGKENSQAFILFFPGEARAAKLLRSSKASGVLAIKESLNAIESALRADEQFQISQTLQPSEVEFWLLMLQRVRSGFTKIRTHFRYDDVRGKAMPDNSLKFTVVNPLHEGRRLDRFAIVWPGAGAAGKPFQQLVFLNAEGNLPPFESWPLNDQGYPLREWHLDLGRSARAIFGRMTLMDRDLLACVLGEIPNFLHHHNARNPSQAVDRKQLSAVVKRLNRRWRSLALVSSLSVAKLWKR